MQHAGALGFDAPKATDATDAPKATVGAGWFDGCAPEVFPAAICFGVRHASAPAFVLGGGVAMVAVEVMAGVDAFAVLAGAFSGAHVSSRLAGCDSVGRYGVGFDSFVFCANPVWPAPEACVVTSDAFACRIKLPSVPVAPALDGGGSGRDISGYAFSPKQVTSSSLSGCPVAGWQLCAVWVA